MSTTPIKIYRIEHPESGNGIYRDGERSTKLYDVTGESPSDQHPMPMDDPLFRREAIEKGSSRGYFDLPDYFFGFDSIEQLFKWVYSVEMIKALFAEGFVFTIYKSDDFILGEKQAAFNKGEAELFAQEDLDFLLTLLN